MVIWPAFRMGQYRVNDHPYHAPQLKHPFGRGLENSISRIMREIYEMENPNPLLFEEIVEIIEIIGMSIARVTQDLKILSLEHYFDNSKFLKDLTAGGCPFHSQK